MTLRINDNGTDRDMTKNEEAAYETWAATAQAENAAHAATVEAKGAARASALAKLAGLGLTDDEIAALVG
jgi:hypothetical protein